MNRIHLRECDEDDPTVQMSGAQLRQLLDDEAPEAPEADAGVLLAHDEGSLDEPPAVEEGSGATQAPPVATWRARAWIGAALTLTALVMAAFLLRF